MTQHISRLAHSAARRHFVLGACASAAALAFTAVGFGFPSFIAQALAAVSMRNMHATDAISMTMIAAMALADGGGTLARGARTSTQIHRRKFLSMFCRGADEAETLPPFTARLRKRKPRC